MVVYGVGSKQRFPCIMQRKAMCRNDPCPQNEDKRKKLAEQPKDTMSQLVLHSLCLILVAILMNLLLANCGQHRLLASRQNLQYASPLNTLFFDLMT